MVHIISKKTPREILDSAYAEAQNSIQNGTDEEYILQHLKPDQFSKLSLLVDKIDSHKAVVTALATSLVKKIEDPSQDTRLHKTMFPNGYSARSYDTKYITPFFKEKFGRLAMKESGWLTRSIEQPHPFDRQFSGKIRDSTVKESFLNILEDIEVNRTDPRRYLVVLILLLIKKTEVSERLIQTTLHEAKEIPDEIAIDHIVPALKNHFFNQYSVAGASRLPVIAIYSIYCSLMTDVQRYSGKTLKPIKDHTTSDLKSDEVGDIEILDENGLVFESVEIKHYIDIDAMMLRDVYDKIRAIPISRYYLLTTAEPNIVPNEEDKIKQWQKRIRHEHGCEVIVNGIIPSLKYYLRLIKSPSEFIRTYTLNLEEAYKSNTDIKDEHLEYWKAIIADLKLKSYHQP